MKYYLNNNYYFITCRTLNQEHLFATDQSKQLILNALLKISKKFNFKFEAFSILSNHYHLLFYLTYGTDLKKIMQMINGGVSYNLNRSRNLYASAWDRYYSQNILNEDSYYKVLGYILGNPFKHGLVENIEKLSNYKFCNYNEKVAELGNTAINEIISKIKNLNWEIN